MPSHNFSMRRADTNDLPFVRYCAEQAYQIYVPRIGKTPAPMVADFAANLAKGHLDILVSDQKNAGFAVTYARDDHLFIENIALLSKFQGQGIARQLFRELEHQANQKGLAALELYTNEKMTENLQLYPHLGFVEIDHREEEGFKRVYFRKELQIPAKDRI